MYQDKILVCKDCGKEFTFTRGEQEFYASKRVLKTNLHAAKNAVHGEKHAHQTARQSQQESTMLQLAPTAAKRQECLLNPERTDLFCAALATL